MKTLIILLNILWCFGFADAAQIEHGKASWYSVRCNHGTRTASGQKLSNSANTAASKTLPMGTKVKVTNLKNGRSEIVTITDFGPFIRNRIIDVTIGVADKLGFKKSGIAKVRIEVVGKVKLYK